MSNLAEKETRRSEEHTSELQSRLHLVCRLLLEKKKRAPRTADAATRFSTLTAHRALRARARRDATASISPSPARRAVRSPPIVLFFFFNDTATTEIYPLSLPDALPISSVAGTAVAARRSPAAAAQRPRAGSRTDRKSTRLNSSHLVISYAVFCLKK